MSANNQDQPLRGGHSLGGSGPAEPLPEEWARSSRPLSGTSRPTGSQRFATLRDISSAPGPSMSTGAGGLGGFGGSAGDDEDDDGPEGDDNDSGENWYAGGERSGISVENPDRAPRQGNHLVRDILRKAADRAGQAPQPPTAPSGPFSGSGYTLGSDDVQSSYIPDPNAPQGNSYLPDVDFGASPNQLFRSGEAGDDQEVATRHITFWRDGFSVEDGPLMRYDEPANSQLLDEINSGHAPPQILNVRVGQPVELRVTRRLDENYAPAPKRPIAAFEGEGYRLGAAVPEVSSNSTMSSSSLAGAFDHHNVPGSFPSSLSETPDGDSIPTHFEVDHRLPATGVQVRLADGTRLVARMNLTHTVGDIRNFINASRPNFSTTPYTIQTTFPNRILEDNSQTIENAGLKNSVVVQRLV